MNRSALILIATLLLLPVPGDASASWSTSLPAAQKASAASGKPLLIDFYATWCFPCQKMAAETFTDPGVKALLDRVICVRVDVDQQPALARQYEVNALPRVLVLSRGGNSLVDVVGYEDAAGFTGELRRGLGLQPPPVAGRDLALWQVRQALETGRYDAFKAAQPRMAAAGLAQMVEQLGASREADFKTTARLLTRAGADAVPALVHGLENRYLAVRAGSNRALQEMVRNRRILAPPAFDPWVAASRRHEQSVLWLAWWQRARSIP